MKPGRVRALTILLPIVFIWGTVSGGVAAYAAGADEQAMSHSWDAVVEQARAFITRETGVPAERLSAIRVERVEWSDTSLGCAEPGKAYLPVVTPGFQVTLQDGAAVYQVNLAGDLIVSCQRSVAARMQKTGRQTTPAIGFVMDARKDLADRLGVSLNEISIQSVRPVALSGDLPDCSDEAPDSGQAGNRGYEIILGAGESSYRYRALDGLAYCGRTAYPG